MRATRFGLKPGGLNAVRNVSTTTQVNNWGEVHQQAVTAVGGKRDHTEVE